MSDTGGAVVTMVGQLLIAGGVWVTTTRAAGGRLRRNGMAGIRTDATMADENAWRAAHTAALPWARRTAAVCLLGAVVTAGLLTTGLGGAASLAGWVSLLGALALMWPMTKAANEAARAAAPPGPGRRVRVGRG